jgi:hypothetical protein
MNKPHIDKTIWNSMQKQGYLAPGGDDHDPSSDKKDNRIVGPNVMGNVGNLDPDRSKPKSMNPGFDKTFWSKADPQEDTTGHGKLTSGIGRQNGN